MRVPWLVAIGACVPPAYAPSQMGEPRLALGCVDVHADAGWVAEASGPVVMLDFGSRCERGARIDLRALRVVGYRGGEAVPLHPYDPDREIGARTLAPGVLGDEWIEFRPDAATHLDAVEIDVSAIVAGEPTHVAPVLVDLLPHGDAW